MKFLPWYRLHINRIRKPPVGTRVRVLSAAPFSRVGQIVCVGSRCSSSPIGFDVISDAGNIWHIDDYEVIENSATGS